MEDDQGSFSVRVVNSSGFPLEGIKVECFSSYGHNRQYTNSDGWTEFPILEGVWLGGTISIDSVYVDGNQVVSDSFIPTDGQTFSFTKA